MPDLGEPPAGARFLEAELFDSVAPEWTLPPPTRKDPPYWSLSWK